MVSIHDTNSIETFLPLAGRYTVVLQAGYYPGGPIPDLRSAGIAQTGVVPLTTKSLRFLGDIYGSLGVSLDGNSIQIHALESTPQGTVFGADISSWAGQTTELRFSTLGTYANPFTFISLDNIQFSPQAIPEPSVAGFVALAILCSLRQALHGCEPGRARLANRSFF